jgi:putative phosphoribosyl transferase
MGAIATGGVRVLNEDVVRRLGIPDYMIDKIVAEEQQELDRRERDYRGDRPPLDVEGHTVVLVDDGLASGSSMRVAALALRNKKPAEIIVAVPVAAPATCAEFESEVDQVICAVTPDPLILRGWSSIMFGRGLNNLHAPEHRRPRRHGEAPRAVREPSLQSRSN